MFTVGEVEGVGGENINWVSISFRSSGTIISGLFLIFQTFKDACWSLLLYQKEPEREKLRAERKIMIMG